MTDSDWLGKSHASLAGALHASQVMHSHLPTSKGYVAMWNALEDALALLPINTLVEWMDELIDRDDGASSDPVICLYSMVEDAKANAEAKIAQASNVAGMREHKSK